jgi:hypothetical protein
MIDWADLDFETQLFLLKQVVADSTLLREICSDGPSSANLLDWPTCPTPAIIEHNHQVVVERYSLKNYARRLLNLYTRGGQAMSRPVHTAAVIDHRRLLAQACSLENLRLLV